MIDFNRPPVIGTEAGYFQKALENGKLCGDGPFTKYASEWLSRRFDVPHCYLTTSCTSALEMASWLCDLYLCFHGGCVRAAGGKDRFC